MATHSSILAWEIPRTGVHALEKEMATHSSVLAWRIPGTGEPGGLPSMSGRNLAPGEGTNSEEEITQVEICPRG